MTKKTISLVFKQKPKNTSPIKLIFGKDNGGENPAIIHLVDAVINIDDLDVSAAISNDYGLNENIISIDHNAIFNQAALVIIQHDISWALSELNNYDVDVTFDNAEKIQIQKLAFWHESYDLQNDNNTKWGSTNLLQSSSNASASNTDKREELNIAKWGDCVLISAQNSGYSSHALLYEHESLTKWSKTHKIETIAHDIISFANITELKEKAQWGYSILPEFGTSTRPDWDFKWEPKKPILITRQLHFCKERNNQSPIKLIFGQKCVPKIKDNGTYLIENDVSVIRIDDGLEIDIVSANVGIDRQSFAWAGSFTIPKSELQKVMDKPEVEIKMNQLKWRMDIESINTNLSFNNSYVTINCISSAMQLSAIPSTEIDVDSTAQGIISAQIDSAGLDTGYEVEWNAVDWLIPAGLISFYRKKVIEVISEITEAAGAIITPHYHERKLISRNKYDQYHWDELKPLITIPMNVLTIYDESEQETGSIDSIIVTGENIGVTAQVRRFGFDGSKPGEMIVDKLITEERVARARGAAVINETGNKLMVYGEMPLVKDIGYYYPSDVIQIDQKKGYIDQIDVTASKDGDTTIVRYGVTIEYHKNDVF